MAEVVEPATNHTLSVGAVYEEALIDGAWQPEMQEAA